MLRASIKKALTPDPYAYMFLLLGVVLGSAFHIFNSKGRDLVTSVISALSSPELFYLLLSLSGTLLCLRNVFCGPIGEASLFTKNIVLFPGETAIEAMKSLTALLLGLLVPLWLFSDELGKLILLFLFYVFLSNFSASALFSFSYKKTCPKDIDDRKFRIINLFVVIVLATFFYWQFVRVVT